VNVVRDAKVFPVLTAAWQASARSLGRPIVIDVVDGKEGQDGGSATDATSAVSIHTPPLQLFSLLFGANKAGWAIDFARRMRLTALHAFALGDESFLVVAGTTKFFFLAAVGTNFVMRGQRAYSANSAIANRFLSQFPAITVFLQTVGALLFAWHCRIAALLADGRLRFPGSTSSEFGLAASAANFASLIIRSQIRLLALDANSSRLSCSFDSLGAISPRLNALGTPRPLTVDGSGTGAALAYRRLLLARAEQGRLVRSHDSRSPCEQGCGEGRSDDGVIRRSASLYRAVSRSQSRAA
jgi:hypothetical protein